MKKQTSVLTAAILNLVALSLPAWSQVGAGSTGGSATGSAAGGSSVGAPVGGGMSMPSLQPPIGSTSPGGTGTSVSTPGSSQPFSSPTQPPAVTNPGTPIAPGSSLNQTPTFPSSPTNATPGAPTPFNSTNTPTPPVPGGALSPATSGAPNTTDVLNMNASAPPPPLMGTITQEVALTIDKQTIQRGPFVGLVLHLHNGTNSALLFDGNRARVNIDGKNVDAVTDAALEAVTAPPPTIADDAKIAVADAVTVGAVSAVRDHRLEHGEILPRYGKDQMRREATLERFGTRILWPGDDTQGIVFFRTSQKINTTNVELPVVTFPDMEIRGYLGVH